MTFGSTLPAIVSMLPAAFRQAFTRNIHKLAESPGIGHVREDLAEERQLLFWPVRNYVILYRAMKKPIEIVAIAHGKRDIPAFIRRRGLQRREGL